MTFLSDVPTYRCFIDLNDDGDFDDSGENLSDDFLSANIDRGFSGPLARVAKTGTATLVLSNLNKQYSPPNAASMLPNRKVRIEMGDGTTNLPLFTGFIRNIKPTAGKNGARQVTLECEDALGMIGNTQAVLQLATNTNACQVISTIVEAVYTPPGSQYEPGINLFPFANDQFSSTDGYGVGYQEVTAGQKILDACASDWGRFFISRGGSPTFYNRHHYIVSCATCLTLNDDMVGMEYAKSIDTVHNFVEVKCAPRSVSSNADEVVASLAQTSPLLLESGKTNTLILKLRDPDNTDAPVSVLGSVTITASANSLPDNNGYDKTSELLTVVGSNEPAADQVTIGFSTSASDPNYLTLVHVKGRPVRTLEGGATMQAQAADSQANYGQRKLNIGAPLIADTTDAQTLADYLLDVYRTPIDQVQGLQLIAIDNTTVLDAVRNLEPGDRLIVSETQTALTSMSGIVLGIKHNIQDKFLHNVTLDLETAFNPGTPFRLDMSRLDSGDRLIY